MAAGLNVRLLGTLDGALDPVQSFVSRPRMTARQRFRRASELPERLVCAECGHPTAASTGAADDRFEGTADIADPGAWRQRSGRPDDLLTMPSKAESRSKGNT